MFTESLNRVWKKKLWITKDVLFIINLLANLFNLYPKSILDIINFKRLHFWLVCKLYNKIEFIVTYYCTII